MIVVEDENEEEKELEKGDVKDDKSVFYSSGLIRFPTSDTNTP